MIRREDVSKRALAIAQARAGRMHPGATPGDVRGVRVGYQDHVDALIEVTNAELERVTRAILDVLGAQVTETDIAAILDKPPAPPVVAREPACGGAGVCRSCGGPPL